MNRCSCGHYKYVHESGTGFCYASFPRPCNCQSFNEAANPEGDATTQVATLKIEEVPVTAKPKAAIQTVLGGSVQNVARSLADRTITSMERESGASSAENRDSDDLRRAEFFLFLKTWRAQGGIPDMSKLAASTQMDVQGFWWGWREAGNLSRCDFCIYEAAYCYLGVYYCRLHWGLFD